MKERNKLIIAIVAVLLIVVAVVAGTYAYWQWQTTTAQRTIVEFTVPNSNDLLSASLDGGGSATVNNLAPAACTNGTYAMKKTLVLTYKNLTTQAAEVHATLTVSNWTHPHGNPDLSKIHFILTENGTTCSTTNAIAGYSGSAYTNFVAGGTLINNVTLLQVPANTAQNTKTYYLYVWIDPTYTNNTSATLNTGSTVNDPMQDLSFTLTWSGEIVNV